MNGRPLGSLFGFIRNTNHVGHAMRIRVVHLVCLSMYAEMIDLVREQNDSSRISVATSKRHRSARTRNPVLFATEIVE